LYEIGAHKGANIYLKQLAKESTEVKNYLREVEDYKDAQGRVLITTHHRLLYEKDFNDIVVVDEDIILNGMYPCDKVSVGELAMLNAKLVSNPHLKSDSKIIGTLLNEIIDAPEGVVKKTPNYFSFYSDEVEKMVVHDENINTNVLGFLNSIYYTKVIDAKKTEYIQYISKRELPKKKCIILSASINETIAKMALGSDINFYDIGEVEQQGEIIQFTSMSYSKSRIFEDYERMLNIAKELIRIYNPGSQVITFKGVFDSISNDNINFWNAAGRDDLKGRDLTVIGTPHVNEVYYLLLSSILGYNVQLSGSSMNYLPVTKGIYKFYFQTYGNNDFLRELQFYIIESALLQTIGRARTLRTNAKVLLLSNYPVPGAELISLSMKELKQLERKSS